MRCLSAAIRSELSIPIPSVNKQKKFGEELSLLDNLIRNKMQEAAKLPKVSCKTC